MHPALQTVLVLVALALIVYACYDRWQARRSTAATESEAFYAPSILNTTTPDRGTLVTRPADADAADGCPDVPLAAFAPDAFYLPGDARREYPPVWVPVDTSLAKVLADYRAPTDPGTFGAAWTASQVAPAFEDVFAGYQRLALRTLHLAFGQRHRIVFVHKGNWHTLLPNLAGSNPLGNHFRADALPDALRMDYVKAQVLAHYGGYWVPPDTIVTRPDFHQWMTTTVLPTARADPNVPADVPLLVTAGHRALGYSVVDGTGAPATKWTHDASVLFAEPHNPVMRAVANRMQTLVTRSFDHSAYTYHQWFTKALHAYAAPSKHGRLAYTVVVLPDAVAGAVDETGDPVTVDHYFRQRPLEHLPSRDARWFVVDTPDRRVTGYPKHEWFAYLTEDAIVQSQLWVAMLYRRGLQLEAAGASGNVRVTAALQADNHPLVGTWAKGWPQVVGAVGEEKVIAPAHPVYQL